MKSLVMLSLLFMISCAAPAPNETGREIGVTAGPTGVGYKQVQTFDAEGLSGIQVCPGGAAQCWSATFLGDDFRPIGDPASGTGKGNIPVPPGADIVTITWEDCPEAGEGDAANAAGGESLPVGTFGQLQAAWNEDDDTVSVYAMLEYHTSEKHALQQLEHLRDEGPGWSTPEGLRVRSHVRVSAGTEFGSTLVEAALPERFEVLELRIDGEVVASGSDDFTMAPAGDGWVVGRVTLPLTSIVLASSVELRLRGVTGHGDVTYSIFGE